ncbi:MAG: hypothetical protein ACLR8Y_11010 [Alistipes indistinctus]
MRNHSYSGLPLLVLSTEGAAPVSSKETWIQGTMRIDRQENDCDEFSGQIEIKGRGSNSWAKDKSPMRSSSPRNNRLWA